MLVILSIAGAETASSSSSSARDCREASRGESRFNEEALSPPPPPPPLARSPSPSRSGVGRRSESRGFPRRRWSPLAVDVNGFSPRGKAVFSQPGEDLIGGNEDISQMCESGWEGGWKRREDEHAVGGGGGAQNGTSEIHSVLKLVPI